VAQQVEVSIDKKTELRCIPGYLECAEVLRESFVEPRREVRRETLQQQVGVFVVNRSIVVASRARRQRDVVHISRAEEISADLDGFPVEPRLVRLVGTLIAKDDDDDRRPRLIVSEPRKRARHRGAELLEAEGDIPDVTRTRVAKQQEVLGSQRRPVRRSRRCGEDDAGGGRHE